MRALSLLFVLAVEVWADLIWILVFFACVIGVPGVIAWQATAEMGWARVFRTGPALLVPFVFVWAVISHVSCGPGECPPDLWRILPFFAAFAAAVLWHVALILISNREERIPNLLYAVVFLPCLYLYSQCAMVLAVRFPL
jgi:hypothetical protein